MTSLSFPYETRAIQISQPLGIYYVAVLPARLLLEVAFSDVTCAKMKADGTGYDLEGTQRLQQPKRLVQIADYLDRGDAAFPNSIILAANFRQDTGFIEDDVNESDDDPNQNRVGGDQSSDRRWSVTEGLDGCLTLRIPTPEKLAAIIDGQHRLFAFTRAVNERLDMELVCAIFLDLPKPFQAQLFATINSTQKSVDKSLTYELFGYNISDESPDYWTPDKVAVFLTRKLGTEGVSPLRGRIIIAPKKDSALLALGKGNDWKVSTAVVVDGILRLISANPKRDTNELLTPEPKKRNQLRERFHDRSPLREVYISTNDNVLYTMVLNYLLACHDIFWLKASGESFITRTVGLQALFDVLRRLAGPSYVAQDLRVSYFADQLRPAGDIDFSSIEFRVPSGSGRLTIRRALESAMHLKR